MGLISRVSSRTYRIINNMALFQAPSAKGGNVVQQNYLAEIRCGRMLMDEATKMVEAQPEKDLLYVKRMNDTLIHLVWKERNNPASKIPDDDLIVFEGDCSGRLIKQLPEHRVFLVKMNQTNTRKLFWLQHTDASKDEELIKNLDDSLNRPSEVEKKQRNAKAASSSKADKEKGGAGGPIDLASLMGADGGNGELLSQLLQSGAVDPNTMNSLLQQINGAGASASDSTTTMDTPVASNSKKSSSKKSKLGANDLQQAFGMVQQRGKQYDLNKVLGTESLVGILANKEVQDRLNKHMPKDEKIGQSKEELRAAIGSPQYQQAVQAFQEALESGQLAPVLQQFNLPEEAIKAAAGGNMKAFAEAMEKSKKKEEKSETEDSKNETSTPTAKKDDDDKKDEKTKDDEDEKMAVD